MDGTFAGHALDFTVPRQNRNPPTGNHTTIMSAQGIKIEKALFADVGQDQAELIDVTGQEDRRISLRIHRGEAVAHGVFTIGIDD